MMEDVDEIEEKRSGCDVCDERFLAKKRRLSRIEANDFHHPLFDDVDATGEDEAQPSIHVLNDECMDLILSYFNTVEHCRLGLVCRRWYNLCMSKISRIDYLSVDQLKRQLLGEDYDKYDTEAMSKIYKETGRFEVILKIIEKEFSVMSVMSVVSINCGTLTTVSLIDVDGLNAASLSILASMMPNLAELELTENLKINEELCKIMAEEIIPKLEALSFFAESVPDNISLRKMLSSARRLRFLSLKESFKAEVYEDDTLEENGPGLLEVLAPTNPLVSCSFHGYVNLRPKSLEYILRNYSDTLEYLNLSGTNLQGLTNMVTDSLPKLKRMKVFIASIKTRLGDVEELPLSLHTRCSQQLVALLKLMPNLRVLDLSNNYYLRFNGVDIVRLLSEHCPLLEELHLTKCAVPAEKLVNLTKLKFLKILFLGEVHDYEGSPANTDVDAATNLVDCFKCVTRQVLPYLTNLEELSIEAPAHAFPADDIVSFIDNAGPKFKTLSLCTMHDFWVDVESDFDGRHNFFEEAARKCKERCKDRDNAIKLLVDGIDMLHKNPCNTVESRKDCICKYLNFDDIAPKFLRISALEFNHEFGYEDFYPNNVSLSGWIKVDNGFFKLPRFLPGQFSIR